MRNAGAQRIEFCLIFEELNDLLQLLFFLVRTGNILEGGLTALIRLILHPCAADAHCAASAGLLIHKIIESAHHYKREQQNGKHRHKHRRLGRGQNVDL